MSNEADELRKLIRSGVLQAEPLGFGSGRRHPTEPDYSSPWENAVRRIYELERAAETAGGEHG